MIPPPPPKARHDIPKAERADHFTGSTAMPDVKFTVTGTVASRTHPGVGGLRVEVVDKNPGLDDAKLGEGKTDERGRYQAELNLEPLRARAKKEPDLQARVYAGQTFLAASEVRYDASGGETLDVLLPEEAGKALPSEYETLLAAIVANFKGQPRDLQETDGRHDVTHLANKTGWDAPAIVLLLLADQFSSRAHEIHAAFFYALFR